MVYEKQGSISKSFMTSRILSVVIIVNELLRGGAQRIILNLARDIDKGKFSITVVYLKSHKNFGPDAATLEDELRQTGIRVISLEGAQRFTPTDLLKLIRLLRNEKPDIVHTFLPYAGTLGRIAARIAGVPRIVSVQCNVRVAYDFWRYWLDRATLILAHAWIGATEGIELEYGGSVAHFSKEEWNRGRRHFSIPSGVNMEAIAESLAQLDRSKKRRELEVPSDGVMILMTARLIRWKGHHDLLRALVHLPDSVHVFCAGWGPLREELLALARELRVSDRYHLLGARSDIYELLGAADVYVQAHSAAPGGRIWNGPNASQVEACAAGVPSVSTSVPLIEYLIEDGITGKLAEPNDPSSLSAAIKWMIDHPKEASSLGKAGRERVRERYTLERMVNQYEDLYLSL
ncbi:MAG TPA: glycosyltransferase [Candidatus Paceibacterota bacterium]